MNAREELERQALLRRLERERDGWVERDLRREQDRLVRENVPGRRRSQ